MASISLVSTLLPPQHAPVPTITATSAANPTAILPPTSASFANSDSGSSTDSGAGSGGGGSGYGAAQSQTTQPSLPDASASSVVSAKTQTTPPSSDAVPELDPRGTRIDGYGLGSVTGSAPDTTHRPLPKAVGPLPIPTADILLRLQSSGKD